MVFYLKYRPQTIEELDSENVKKTLVSVLGAKSTPHAFLFTGPKGLGKTSTARIVAKYVNCEGKKEKPCNKCISCSSITKGTNVDVLEIDAASNRGIDEIRDLREKIRLLPVSAKKKIYIIDEVHMLTTEAFNALLKTLEEPPSHAMLILCTTEPQKVPATILSRCFHIQFKKATIADLVHSFERIIKAEKIEADHAALTGIASYADGSFRDGAKLLEEIALSANGKKITTDMLERLYHTDSIESDARSMLVLLRDNEKKKALEMVQKLLEQGADMKYFLEQLLLRLHTLLLIKTGVLQESEVIDMDLETIKKLVAVLVKAHGEVKSAVLPSLPLELAIVEWGEDKGKGESVKGKGIEQKDELVQQSPKYDDKTLLHQVLDSIKAENQMLAGVLRSCKIFQTEKAITIEAPSPFHSERLKEKKALEILEKVCEDITGKKATISVVLK